eukprot:TRINITY_DN16887_c0_g1_i1.p3 TRINITY_DN16887_c0_g1~~TRINITY_DN16887_c0_g1_i1.p3  ORF type:complete len:204 (-),score=43.23 TRINITY_DN16887_c0_g1_i1:218-829(-)
MAEPGAPAHNATCDAFVHLHSLPPRLLELDLRGCGEMFELPAFPASLEVLKLPGRYSTPIAALPASLQQLWLGGRFNSALGPLPRRLRQLHVVEYEGTTRFNKRLGALPDSLQELLFGTAFTQRLGKLPAALKRLCIDCPKYAHSLGRLPGGLVELKFSVDNYKFNHALGQLPPTLRALTLGSSFLQPLGAQPEGLLVFRRDD